MSELYVTRSFCFYPVWSETGRELVRRKEQKNIATNAHSVSFSYSSDLKHLNGISEITDSVSLLILILALA
jgi:hypothetical protein